MSRWCLIFLALWAFLEFAACSPSGPPGCYEMPDGSFCHMKYGDAMTHKNEKYERCDNGREYMNPAWSKWHYQCPKEFK